MVDLRVVTLSNAAVDAVKTLVSRCDGEVLPDEAVHPIGNLLTTAGATYDVTVVALRREAPDVR